MNEKVGSNIDDAGQCTGCGHDITDAEASVEHVIAPKDDPEGKCRIEIRLECSGCGVDLRAFVAEEQFVDSATFEEDDGVLL